MITIGICDDKEQWRKKLIASCCSFLNECGYKYEIVEFYSGEEILTYSGREILLLFLDIEMQGISGIELLNFMRDNPLFWRVVFVSSHEELRFDTIDIKVLSFVNKPFDDIIIAKCIRAAVRENERNKVFSVKTLEGNVVIKADDVKYIKAQKNYVEICCKDKVMSGYDSIKDLEERLKETTLLRIHKSFLVNLQYVSDVTYNGITLLDGTVIPVGRMYYMEYREAYFTYVKMMSIERLG